jgi:hypothetical protein
VIVAVRISKANKSVRANAFEFCELARIRIHGAEANEPR